MVNILQDLGEYDTYALLIPVKITQEGYDLLMQSPPAAFIDEASKVLTEFLNEWVEKHREPE